MKYRWRTKAEWMADHAAMFDASPFKDDKDRRDAFLKCAERFFDQEAANSWGGQFSASGRSSTDDGVARSQYFQEIESLKKEISCPRVACVLQEKRDAILEAQSEAGSRQYLNVRPPGRFAELTGLLGVPLGLGLLALVAYIYNEDIGRVVNPFLARQIPSLGYSTDRQTVRYFADPNGQFDIDGRANEIWFRFVADTGAAGIVFSKADAQRLGFDTSTLRFDRTAWTANGLVRVASVQLKKLEIGPIVVVDVPAWIDDGDLQRPLLGMEFFKRVSTIEINNGTLTIHR